MAFSSVIVFANATFSFGFLPSGGCRTIVALGLAFLLAIARRKCSPVNLAFDCFKVNGCNKIEMKEEKKKESNRQKSAKSREKDKLK